MNIDIEKQIAERETAEALNSRYEKTINRHRYTSVENLKLPVYELMSKYIDECDSEDKGIYRSHKFKLTRYQEQWKDWLMQKEYKYMITIKLPHREINGFKRTYNQESAKVQLRKLIREIEREYTGHNHWEKDAFDFNLAFEHGESGFWHVHIAVVSNTMNYETYYNKLQAAINRVLQKIGLFNTCIKLTYIYDQEGLCCYFVKELEEPDNNHLQKEYSYLVSLWDWFRIDINKPAVSGVRDSKWIKMLYNAVKMKSKHSLSVPTPINKLSKSSHKQAQNTHKTKR